MNRHTFQDAVASRRSALINDVEEDEDDEREVNVLRQKVDGEEDDGQEKYNEVGELIEPFNLRGEREEGHFDENMNFVFKKERGEVDAWLASMDEETMEKSIGEAAMALKKQQEDEKKVTESRSYLSTLTPNQLKGLLIQLIYPEETVTTALKRLSASTRMPKGKVKPKHHTSSLSRDEDPAANKLKLNQLIECTDTLISLGLLDIYNCTYEAIYHSICLWEYKDNYGQIQGPYTSSQISEWKKQGFFTGDSAVLMRYCGRLADSIINTSSNIIHTSDPVLSTQEKSSYFESNVGDKRRINDTSVTISEDSTTTTTTKRQKQQSLIQSTHHNNIPTSDDLLADLNDDDDDDDDDNNNLNHHNDNTRNTPTHNNNNNNNNSNSYDSSQTSTHSTRVYQDLIYTEDEKGPWLLSDEIDFGESTIITNMSSIVIQYDKNTTTTTKSVITTSSSSSSSSSNIDNNSVRGHGNKGNKHVNFQLNNDTNMNDDNDINEDEVEDDEEDDLAAINGGIQSHKKKRKVQFKMMHRDESDSDDQD